MSTHSTRPADAARAGAPNGALALLFAVTVFAAGAAPRALGAQGIEPPPTPRADSAVWDLGRRYAAGPLKRFFLGDYWRDLWTVPVRAPVLDIGTFAGGLEPEEQGGGNQSITLHMVDPQGREWVFRSVDKFPNQGLPNDLQDTPAGELIQDQIRAMFPAAPLAVPPFLEALDILHVEPTLYLMPDDPRLGEFRETFAGMLGTIELRPNEGEDDAPGFAGSRSIKGTDEFFEDLAEEHGHGLDAREFLRARLLDFLIGDTDRGSDQWRWARFGEDGDYRWRPIPRDRDWAFVNADGLLPALIRGEYRKFTTFREDIPQPDVLTYSSHILDRRLLSELDRAAFREEAARVQAAVTDQVIARSLERLPPEWREETNLRALYARRLRQRAETLPAAADAFYAWLAAEPDLHGTHEPDAATVLRYPDGRVQVVLAPREPRQVAGSDGAAAAPAYFRRIFLPAETREIRIHLHGGDDVATVRGASSDAITVRIVGGEGDDLLADSAGGATYFYDAYGENRFVGGAGVSTKEWAPPLPTEGFRGASDWVPEWGGERGWGPVFDYREGAGIIVGYGPAWTDRGFRRYPYHYRVQLAPLYATSAGGFGADLQVDYRFENAPRGLALHARATQFESFRFFGFGNATPNLGTDATLVLQDEVLLEAGYAWYFGWRPDIVLASDTAGDAAELGATLDLREEDARPAEEMRAATGRLLVGPVLHWRDPDLEQGTPLALERPLGSDALGVVGAGARLDIDRTDGFTAPRRGFRLDARVAAFPDLWDAAGAFTEAAGEAAVYVPLVGDGPHLAVRAGGALLGGEFPVQHAAFLGGKETLRGFRFQRLAGDASAYGSAELRVPVDSVTVLTRGELGVFGLVDAGRVWFDGESPGGWHTAYGGGLWFASLGRALSVAYARGEEGRFYVKLGLPF